MSQLVPVIGVATLLLAATVLVFLLMTAVWCPVGPRWSRIRASGR